MKNLQDYIDKAIELRGFASVRQLSIALGKDPTTVAQYRRLGIFPDDAVMVKLATFADCDPTKALIDLNSWRVKDPDVQRIYKKLAKTMATVIVMGTMLGPPGSSKASAEQTSHRSTFIESQCILWGFLRRWWGARRRRDLAQTA